MGVCVRAGGASRGPGPAVTAGGGKFRQWPSGIPCSLERQGAIRAIPSGLGSPPSPFTVPRSEKRGHLVEGF